MFFKPTCDITRVLPWGGKNNFLNFYTVTRHRIYLTAIITLEVMVIFIYVENLLVAVLSFKTVTSSNNDERVMY